MTAGPVALPDGFGVRLHDDVEVGPFLVSGTRVVRLSPTARDLLRNREITVTSPVTSALAVRLLDLDLADPDLHHVAGPGLDELTVVVPVRDRADGVERLLRSLAPHMSCIVIDDASSDPGALGDVARRHGARLVRLDRNSGPAAARNLGLGRVRTPFVAFVDSDVHTSAANLQNLLHHMTDPGLAAVGPRVSSRGGDRWLDRYEDTSGSLDLGPTSATVRKWSPVAYIPSACLVARVASLGAAFDARLRSGEDVDLVWRLQDEGHRVRYAAEVVVQHDTRGSLGGWLARQAFYGTSAAPLAARHGDRVAPAVITPVAAAGVAGLLLQRRWSLSVAAVCALITVINTWSYPPDLPTRQKTDVVRSFGDATARQTSGLILRHWSPAALMLSAVSSRARRVVTVLAVGDGLVAYWTTRPGLDPVRFTLARRAEHLAYGGGVWWGAWRARSARCLTPRWLPVRAGRVNR